MSVPPVRLLICVAHPATLESAISDELHSLNADPFVSFVWLYIGFLDKLADACRVCIRRSGKKRIHADRKNASTFHLLENPVLRQRNSGLADARKPRRIEF